MNTDYSPSTGNQWDEYAPSFCPITTPYQARLYRAAVLPLTGRVIDFGSGPAKLAPYLACNKNVVSYTGVDSSPEMIALSGKMLEIIADVRFKTVCSSIEDLDISGYSSGVSINSYYAWDNPEQVLRKIASVLDDGANFVLATPNPALDMERIMSESWKELILQPEFGSFRMWNEIFASTMREKFVSMDELIGKLRSAGFEIVNCHTDFYEGGINFIHAKKR